MILVNFTLCWCQSLYQSDAFVHHEDTFSQTANFSRCQTFKILLIRFQVKIQQGPGSMIHSGVISKCKWEDIMMKMYVPLGIFRVVAQFLKLHFNGRHGGWSRHLQNYSSSCRSESQHSAPEVHGWVVVVSVTRNCKMPFGTQLVEAFDPGHHGHSHKCKI